MSITYKGNPVYHVIDKSGEEIGYWEKDGVKYHSFYAEGPSITIGTGSGKVTGSTTCYTGKPSQASIHTGYTIVNNWVGSGFVAFKNTNANKVKFFANATTPTNRGGSVVVNPAGRYVTHDLSNQSNAYTDVVTEIPANQTYYLGIHPGNSTGFGSITISYTWLNIKNVELKSYTHASGVTNYLKTITFYNPNSVAVDVFLEKDPDDLGNYDYFTISAYRTATWTWSIGPSYVGDTTFYFAARYYSNSTVNMLSDYNSFVADYINDAETTT
jgi:hypothetical protein